MANENRLIGLSSLSGDEVVVVGQGVGGSGSYVSINALRNGREIATKSGSGAATSVMTAGQSTIIWKGTAPTTWTVTLPPAPPDGAIVTLGTDTTLTTMVTVQAASGDTLSAAVSGVTLTAKTNMTFVYNAADTTWYQTT